MIEGSEITFEGESSWYRVKGSRIRNLGTGIGVHGFEIRGDGRRFRVQSLEFRVKDLGLGFTVQGSEFRAQSLGFGA
jgi:hypothetical protein